MSSNPKIAVILLAAGASTRFGAVKQLLPWKGSTLLKHAIDTILELNVNANFVVLGANQKHIKLITDIEKVEVLVNDTWELGLGNSIAYGVKQILNYNIELDGILLMLADQPLINVNFLKALIDKFDGEADQIIASSYAKGKKGVPVIFGKIYFNELSNLNGDNGAKILLGTYSQNVTTINAEHLVLDIDTKEDYEQLYKANH